MDWCTLYPAECHWLAFPTTPRGKDGCARRPTLFSSLSVGKYISGVSISFWQWHVLNEYIWLLLYSYLLSKLNVPLIMTRNLFCSFRWIYGNLNEKINVFFYFSITVLDKILMLSREEEQEPLFAKWTQDLRDREVTLGWDFLRSALTLTHTN